MKWRCLIKTSIHNPLGDRKVSGDSWLSRRKGVTFECRSVGQSTGSLLLGRSTMRQRSSKLLILVVALNPVAIVAMVNLIRCTNGRSIPPLSVR
jgi:hypothetical protein